MELKEDFTQKGEKLRMKVITCKLNHSLPPYSYTDLQAIERHNEDGIKVDPSSGILRYTHSKKVRVLLIGGIYISTKQYHRRLLTIQKPTHLTVQTTKYMV